MQNPKLKAAAGAIAVALIIASLQLAKNTVDVPDFREFEAGPERKTAFFSYLQPIVEERNAELRDNRGRLLSLAESDDIGRRDSRFVKKMAAEYKLPVSNDDGDPRPAEVLVDELLLRVDEVPISLALAQAAKESGWGTSRFAREGNNFYGEWCYEAGCGIVPASRGAGKKHEVEAFDSPAESVASYMRNINTHNGYKSFRQARKRQRSADDSLSGVKLAEELSQYSERRDAYVVELKQLIVANNLDALESASADN